MSPVKKLFPAQPLIMAPLRGFTDVVFRNVFQKHFVGIDQAVAPFVTSIKGRRIKPAHLQDLAPEENRRLPVVPQILSKDADEFVRLAETLVDLGYREINWNLGCPYPMVAKKMRGSGLLCHPDVIDRLLEEIFKRFSGRLSVKTRLGRFSLAEMEPLIAVFNRYPLERIIVHPRTGVQMYDGHVDLEAFAGFFKQITHPVVYNGDIVDSAVFQKLEVRFANVAGWMLGRGLVADPFLAESIRTGSPIIAHRQTRLAAFHGDLVQGYCRRFSGPGHVLDRMKGFWRYFAAWLPEGNKTLKQIRKAASLDRFEKIVARVFDET
jgi:tRNA-dihydrouridine synthase